MTDYTRIYQKYFEEDYPKNAAKASAEIGDGKVTVEYDYVGTEGNDYSIIVSDENQGDDDVDLTATLEDGVITVLLGTDPDTDSGATIGSGEKGTVTVNVDASVEQNDYTIQVVEGEDGGDLNVALDSTDITVTLGMTTATAAEASIGSGDNGTVEIGVVAVGEAGNDYTVEVVEGDADGVDMSAVLTDTALVVTLGTDDGDNATATIGSGEHGTVSIEVDAAGSAGNDYTVAVDATLLEQDRTLSADLTDGALTVTLATEGNENATATIGSGANGRVYITADNAGTDANSAVVTVDADITGENRALTVETPSPTELNIYLATEGITKASADIGSGEDGTVSIEVNEAGAGGNSYTVEVVAGEGVLDISVDQYVITVTLAAGGNTATEIANEFNGSHGDLFTATASGLGSGSVDVAAPVTFEGGTSQLMTIANTATLIAAEIQSTLDFSATASGDGTTSLSVDETQNFTGGTNRLATAANTATLVAAAINDGTDGLTATASGTGGDSLTESVSVTNFTGGGENFALDDVKNAAGLVATAIGIAAVDILLATATNTGLDPLTQAEEVQSFEGGTDSIPDDAKNTATLVAAEIDLLENITAEASGDGSSPLTEAEEQKSFSGGTDSGDISVSKNTSALIAQVISTLDDITATATGSGSITAAEEEQEFTGGQYATESKTPCYMIIDDVWYFCNAGVDKWDESGWYSGTPQLIE